MYRCRYQWINHAGKARKAGVPDALVDALGQGLAPPPEGADALVEAWRLIDDLQSRDAVGDEAFDAICTRYGQRGAAELTAFCALAASVALLLNVRQPPLADKGAAPF